MTNVIKILKPDGTTTEIELSESATILIKTPQSEVIVEQGSIVSMTERRGHPYLDEAGAFRPSWDGDIVEAVAEKYFNAAGELRRFQAMGELPVDGKRQVFLGDSIPLSAIELDHKIGGLTAFFPTREAAEQALADFGGWEHLRRVRRQFHMVGEGE